MRQEAQVGTVAASVMTTAPAEWLQADPVRLAMQPETAQSGVPALPSPGAAEQQLGRRPLAKPAPLALTGLGRQLRVDSEHANCGALRHAPRNRAHT